MNLKESLDVIKKHWNAAPVPVDTISWELGVPIMYANLPENISGAITKDGSAAYKIVVNENHTKTRRRFTIAHELGHFIYHRDLLGKGVGDTRAYRAEDTPYPNINITAVQERQANTFAANLLMPNHLIKELQAKGLKSPQQLAQALEVSEAAMRIKLGVDREPVGQEDGEPSDEWKPPHL
ncbi:MAG TPA: ImmA/IrrE family metallo-endopeptidase [Rhizomicrobium sp.]